MRPLIPRTPKGWSIGEAISHYGHTKKYKTLSKLHAKKMRHAARQEALAEIEAGLDELDDWDAWRYEGWADDDGEYDDSQMWIEPLVEDIRDDPCWDDYEDPFYDPYDSCWDEALDQPADCAIF